MNIDTIDNLDDINDIINDAQNQKIKILNNYWEKLYKNRCPKSYISLLEVINGIFWESKYKYHNTLNIPPLDDFYTIFYTIDSYLDISHILDICKYRNFKIDYEFSKMICEACACEGCPYMKEHLSCTCIDCKKNFYTMYSDYCDE